MFSHWVLDLLVHRPDLPLYDNSAKVGLGLWNVPAIELPLEALILLGGMWLCFRDNLSRAKGTFVFGVVLVAVQVYSFFAPPPASDKAIAIDCDPLVYRVRARDLVAAGSEVGESEFVSELEN